MSRRLGILVSHPIQYYAPWFRHLALRMDVEVMYAHRQDEAAQARAGFGVGFSWDVALLDGYRYRWLRNVARRPSVDSFWGCDTPEIYGLIGGRRYDAVLAIGWNRKSALQAIRACWRAGIPILMRGDSQLPGERPWGLRALKALPYRWMLPRLDGHLYVGARNREYLMWYGVPCAQLFFAPHCVDNSFFASGAQRAEESGEWRVVRRQLGIPEDAFVFLFVGKMIARKRPEDLVQAMLRLAKSTACAGIHVLFAGDGPLRADIERAAAPLAGRIHLAGFCNQNRLPAFYRASNALVLPSDGRETWGMVVNEAAACGVPAVVSDAVGCGPDMIDAGSTGFTYPVGDIAALAARLISLKELCEHRGDFVREALRRKVAAYSLESATAGLEGALEAVCEGGNDGPDIGN